MVDTFPAPRPVLAAVVLVASVVASGVAAAHPAPPVAGAASPAVSARPAARYGWPLVPPHPVVRAFQPPASAYGASHRGVDLASAGGAEVYAAGDGTVVYAGQLAGRGVVSIEHEGGLRTTYEPIDPAVAAGAHVTRGQVVGNLRGGHPGCPVGLVCLHWGARRGLEYLDPLRLLSAGTVRLLTWRAPAGS